MLSRFSFRSDVRSRMVYAVSDLINGEAMQWYLNLCAPRGLIVLEEDLRALLQGKTEALESVEEHARLSADRSKTAVKSCFIPGTQGPAYEGEYPTTEVYELVCALNVLREIMLQFWSGAEKINDYEAELQKKMEMIPSGPD